jgi:hypothetical protein
MERWPSSGRQAEICSAPTARFSWFSGTIFGFAVVPLVCSTSATSGRAPSSRSTVAGSAQLGR